MRPVHSRNTDDNQIYLDHASTTSIMPEIISDILNAMTVAYGNPSSAHLKGIEAEQLVRKAREAIAAAMGARPEEIMFTSGGTEGNNMALVGAAKLRQGRGRHIVTTPIEHSSVLNTVMYLKGEGFDVSTVPVNDQGFVSREDLTATIRPDTILVSVATVNNEIGTMNCIADLAISAKRLSPQLLFHSDGVQAFGKTDISPREMGIDLFTLSGHKIHAPKGVGALWIRDGLHIKPIFHGGGQEKGRRSGTENVPGIIGFGAAVELIAGNISGRERRMRQLRDWIIKRLSKIPDSRLNGPPDELAAPHIINYSFDRVQGEVLVRMLSGKGVYVSTGSACSSRRAKASHVLTAIRTPDWAVRGSIRISLSPFTQGTDVEKAVKLIEQSVEELRSRGRRTGRRPAKRTVHR